VDGAQGAHGGVNIVEAGHVVQRGQGRLQHRKCVRAPEPRNGSTWPIPYASRIRLAAASIDSTLASLIVPREAIGEPIEAPLQSAECALGAPWSGAIMTRSQFDQRSSERHQTAGCHPHGYEETSSIPARDGPSSVPYTWPR
jgi:hypothetical protein